MSADAARDSQFEQRSAQATTGASSSSSSSTSSGTLAVSIAERNRIRGASSSSNSSADNPALTAADSAPAEKRHECTFDGCGKSFKEKKVLRKHLLTHQPRRFHCEFPECSKSFYERAKLKRHQLVHSGEKSFSCTFVGCKKRFALKANLLTHARVHTGTRPYKCPFPGCDKRFSQTSGRNSHYKTHLKGLTAAGTANAPAALTGFSDLKQLVGKDSAESGSVGLQEGPDLVVASNTVSPEASAAARTLGTRQRSASDSITSISAKRPRAASEGQAEDPYTQTSMFARALNNSSFYSNRTSVIGSPPAASNSSRPNSELPGMNLLQLLAKASALSSHPSFSASSASSASSLSSSSSLAFGNMADASTAQKPLLEQSDDDKLDKSLWLGVLGRLPSTHSSSAQDSQPRSDPSPGKSGRKS